jgi:hypothetical protein
VLWADINISEEHVASISGLKCASVTSVERQYYAKAISQTPVITTQWGYSTPCPFYQGAGMKVPFHT